MIDIFIDTREQKKLEFSAEYIDNVLVTKLPFGDYGAKYEGARIPVVFERKSKADLWGTLGSTKLKHDRFKREMAKAEADGCKLILIIECGLLSIDSGCTYRKHGKSIKCKFGGRALLRKLFTMLFKHNLPFVTCKNREEMSLYISEFFYSYSKNLGAKDD